MADQVLDLTTLQPKRPTVKITSELHPEGRAYELAVLDDFSVSDQQYLWTRAATLEKLVVERDIPEDDRLELEMIVDRMVTMMLPDLEQAVAGALAPGQKLAIVQAFTDASPELKARAEAIAKKLLTGGSPSPGSSASTGGTPGAGSS